MRLLLVFASCAFCCSILNRADCNLSFDRAVVLGRVTSSDVTEASGLASSWRNPGVLWTHNDGSKQKIFALSTDGSLLATFKLTKSVADVEDIAVGPGPEAALSYLYVGDIGSNTADRDEIQILRTPEPWVSLDGSNGTVDFATLESFTLKYPSGKHDAEALMVDPVRRELYIATKNDNGAHLFRLSLESLVGGSKGTLEEVADLAFSRISGGAISRDGTLVALRREDEAHVWKRQPSESIVEALRRPPDTLPVVGPPDEPNGEALTFLVDNSGYVTLSEGAEQPLFLFKRVSAGAEPAFLGEPAIRGGAMEIQVSACAGGQIAVQRSSDLQSWENAEIFISTGEVHTFVDAASQGFRFYRLRVP